MVADRVGRSSNTRFATASRRSAGGNSGVQPHVRRPRQLLRRVVPGLVDHHHQHLCPRPGRPTGRTRPALPPSAPCPPSGAATGGSARSPGGCRTPAPARTGAARCSSGGCPATPTPAAPPASGRAAPRPRTTARPACPGGRFAGPPGASGSSPPRRDSPGAAPRSRPPSGAGPRRGEPGCSLPGTTTWREALVNRIPVVSSSAAEG